MTAKHTVTIFCDATACYRIYTSDAETYTSDAYTITAARLETAGDWEVIGGRDFCPRHRSPQPSERVMTSSDIVSAQRDERQDAVHPEPSYFTKSAGDAMAKVTELMSHLKTGNDAAAKLIAEAESAVEDLYYAAKVAEELYGWP